MMKTFYVRKSVPITTQTKYPEQGYYIQHMRKASGLTAKEMAKRLHVSPAMFSYYERGRYQPPDWEVFRHNLQVIVKEEIVSQRKSSLV